MEIKERGRKSAREEAEKTERKQLRELRLE